MKVRLLRTVPAVLTRPDGSVREDYTIAPGEIAEAGYEGNAPCPDDLWTIIVRGWLGTARAVHVSPEAFEAVPDQQPDP